MPLLLLNAFFVFGLWLMLGGRTADGGLFAEIVRVGMGVARGD